jgi:hypothetical protein
MAPFADVTSRVLNPQSGQGLLSPGEKRPPSIRQEPWPVASTRAAGSSWLDRRSPISLAQTMISEALLAQEGYSSMIALAKVTMLSIGEASGPPCISALPALGHLAQLSRCPCAS